MLVSLIESNYVGFGSGVMGGSTGIMLQNRGAYFSLNLRRTRMRWRRALGPFTPSCRHDVEPKTPLMGWAQMVRRLPDGSYDGAADPRADSVAAGL
jgi:gamma-glutamyltranspeptidase